MRIWIACLAVLQTLVCGQIATVYAADLLNEGIPTADELRLRPQTWSGFSGVAFAGGGVVSGRDGVGWDLTMHSGLLGAAAGYDTQFDRIILGGHLEGFFSNFQKTTDSGNVRQSAEWIASITGRLGYDAGRFMPYLTGGLGIAKYKFEQTRPREVIDLLAYDYAVTSPDSFSGGTVTDSRMLYGPVVGAGVETRLTDNLFLRLDYKHFHFLDRDFRFQNGQPFEAGATADIVDLGVGFRF